MGGDGGIIAMDKFGNIGISFNSEGMYRAYINSDGKPVVEIYTRIKTDLCPQIHREISRAKSK